MNNETQRIQHKEMYHRSNITLDQIEQTMGIDFIDVSVGLYETGITCVEPISYPQGWRRELIKAVKDHVHIPVIGVSSIREPAVAEQFLADGVEDFVSMGRSWLADEQWRQKVFAELC